MAKGRDNRQREDSMSDDDMYDFDEDDNVEKSRQDEEISSEEEVYGLGDSDDLGEDDSLDEENDIDMASDIEEENERRPDDRAWGKNNRRYYSTDYVDQDHEGFYEGKEAEEAELEEEEAKQIQKRLVQELNEADFVITEPVSVKQTTENEISEEIERDVSSLTANQKLDLMKKDSPEFFVLVQDFKNKLQEIDATLVPILNFFKDKKETTPALKFLKQKFLILMNYCTNISFYLLLKAKKIPVQNHPVLKSLYKYRKILEQIQEIDEVMKPQIENVLKEIKAGKNPVLDKISRSSKKEKSILNLLKKSKLKFTKEELKNDKRDSGVDNEMNHDESDETDEKQETKQILAEEKRAITYEMAKNKGLMPKRNKDQRNPRVKHRKKYRKALIRRRGQVRTARTEIPVYSGEPTGIKANVTKSIKFK